MAGAGGSMAGAGGATGGAGGSSGVRVSWDAPTTNDDDSCLTDLSGYRLYRGQASGSYGYVENLTVANVSCVDSGTSTSCGSVLRCSYDVSGLAPGDWYFTVTAYNQAGLQSNYATEVSISLP